MEHEPTTLRGVLTRATVKRQDDKDFPITVCLEMQPERSAPGVPTTAAQRQEVWLRPAQVRDLLLMLGKSLGLEVPGTPPPKQH
jgi:hypothetical protein